jgi:ABC-2 type transport system permease protein
MRSDRLVMLVAAREMRERMRSKAFLISSGFTLLLILGLILVPTVLGGQGLELGVGSVGSGNQEIVEAAIALAEEQAPERPVSIESVAFADRPEAEAALGRGEVDLILVDGETMVVARAGSGFAPDEGRLLLQRAAASVRIQELIGERGEEAIDVVLLLTQDALAVEALEEGPGDPEETMSRGFLAYGGLLLMYIAVLTYGAWTLSGVTEEKSSRVVEILVSTIRPWQLLAGKILGIGGLGLGQFAVTLLAAFVALRATGVIDLPEAPIGFVSVLLVWFVLGFTVYSVVFAAAGSLVSRMEDAQNASLPITLIAVAGFFASFAALEDPSGTVATVTTFIPFTAPFVVPVRFAFEAIPAWQHLIAVLATLAGIYGLIGLAGRVYAGGLLKAGGRVRLTEAFRSAEG